MKKNGISMAVLSFQKQRLILLRTRKFVNTVKEMPPAASARENRIMTGIRSRTFVRAISGTAGMDFDEHRAKALTGLFQGDKVDHGR
ncbi:MAG: hypothetical protein II715_01185 [Clostridia bacterium]|nr:hypothetical protein [Clostridia bacterium]